jgi:hypothetical protein
MVTRPANSCNCRRETRVSLLYLYTKRNIIKKEILYFVVYVKSIILVLKIPYILIVIVHILWQKLLEMRNVYKILVGNIRVRNPLVVHKYKKSGPSIAIMFSGSIFHSQNVLHVSAVQRNTCQPQVKELRDRNSFKRPIIIKKQADLSTLQIFIQIVNTGRKLC